METSYSKIKVRSEKNVKNKLVRGRYVLVGSSKQRSVIKDGAVYIEDNIIRDMGKYDILKKKYRPELEIGTSNHLVMPGLVNAHHHGGNWDVLAGVPDNPLEIWLKSVIVNRIKVQVDNYNGTLLACINRIESGVTCILDQAPGPDPVFVKGYRESLEGSIKAYIDSGIRVAIAPMIGNQNQWVYLDEEKFLAKIPTKIKEYMKPFVGRYEDDAPRRKSYFKTNRELFKIYSKFDGKIKLMMGPTGVLWCSDDLLMEIKMEAKKIGAGIHTHLLETKYQMKYANRKFGKTQVEHLVDLEFLGPEVSCAHCVWLTKKEVELFAKSGAIVVHNPTSNLRLFSGIAPVLFMKEQGITVGLGMDDFTGLSDDDDMFQEMRLCSVLQRVPGIGSRGLTSNQVIDMATVDGAKAAGFRNEIGALQPGFKADMILVNLRRAFSPFVSSWVSLFDIILHRLKAIDVDTVIVNGEIIMEDKRLTRVNKAEVVKKVKQSFKEVDLDTRKKFDEYNKYVTNFYQEWDKEAIGYTYNVYHTTA